MEYQWRESVDGSGFSYQYFFLLFVLLGFVHSGTKELWNQVLSGKIFDGLTLKENNIRLHYSVCGSMQLFFRLILQYCAIETNLS